MKTEKVLENLKIEIYRQISKNNYSLKRFAIICEISYENLLDILYGKRSDIRLSTLLKICDNAGIDILNVLDIEIPEKIRISVKSGGIEFSGEIQNVRSRDR